jgi:sulfate-transporting ATPase
MPGAAHHVERLSEAISIKWNRQGYIEDLKRRKGPDADQPHRVQYRKLVRA